MYNINRKLLRWIEQCHFWSLQRQETLQGPSNISPRNEAHVAQHAIINKMKSYVGYHFLQDMPANQNGQA